MRLSCGDLSRHRRSTPFDRRQCRLNRTAGCHRTGHVLVKSKSPGLVDGTLLTLLFLFRQGIHADETAFLFPPFKSPKPSSDRRDSFFGRICRGGIATAILIDQRRSFMGMLREDECNKQMPTARNNGEFQRPGEWP